MSPLKPYNFCLKHFFAYLAYFSKYLPVKIKINHPVYILLRVRNIIRKRD